MCRDNQRYTYLLNFFHLKQQSASGITSETRPACSVEALWRAEQLSGMQKPLGMQHLTTEPIQTIYGRRQNWKPDLENASLFPVLELHNPQLYPLWDLNNSSSSSSFFFFTFLKEVLRLFPRLHFQDDLLNLSSYFQLSKAATECCKTNLPRLFLQKRCLGDFTGYRPWFDASYEVNVQSVDLGLACRHCIFDVCWVSCISILGQRPNQNLVENSRSIAFLLD
jgi:hypothetical protein